MKDAANPVPKEEKVNQWPQGLLVVGKSQRWFWCWNSNTLLPLSKHRVAFLASNHFSAHLQIPCPWSVPRVSESLAGFWEGSMCQLWAAAELQTCSPAEWDAAILVWVPWPPHEADPFVGFPPAHHQRCPRQLPGSASVCDCPSQCSWSHGKCPMVQSSFPAVIYSTPGLPCQALAPTSFFQPLCCRELEFLSALRSGLFFKTLLKELLFKIRFYFGRGLLSVSPFISKHVKSARA